MLRLLAALAVTVALGLLSRLYPLGWFLWDKSLGDVLYAVAAYLALALLLFRRPPRVVAPLAFGLCLAVEFFQATGIPARYAHVPGVRWLLGTTFAWHDIACYCVGVAVIFAADVLLLRPERRARDRPVRGDLHEDRQARGTGGRGDPPTGACWRGAAAATPLQRRPFVVQPFLLDLPDLALADAEALGHGLAGLRHAHCLVLGLHQRQKDLPAPGLG
jgi:hypothetical protein